VSTPGERMERLLEELGEEEFRRRLYASTLTPEPTERGIARAILEELQQRRDREATRASQWTARWTFGILFVAILALVLERCGGAR
jgi:hypothetical protein